VAASGVETSTTVKPSSAACMKSSSAAAVESCRAPAVESSPSPTVSSMLGKHRLRQPTERNHRDEDKNYSK
jgi:hypothetical protein